MEHFWAPKRQKGAIISKKRSYSREEETSWGDIFRCLKEGIFGSEEDFNEDSEDNFEEVEEAQESKETQQSPKSASRPAHQEADKDSVLCSTLQASLNTFVQTGQASDSLLQLLKEGFDKNPDLLEEIAKFVAIRRRGEERIHPGFLVTYEGKNSMLLSKEKALDFILSRPGAAVSEKIFVSLVKDGKTISTREATEGEKRLYYEQQPSKADATGQIK